ncbi:S1 family peptidase [Corynebacterium choanae]|uniref:Trypsin n=1 Tax=Corynebacterium choanae TaxID=1862358 RepID=A0A3G6J5T8_9CORY|nr:S1 family peptidase [Corynebacterium choanae]AZA13192.1 hypothetical protein CCHOA_03915 [Corynebacterium choanae]
MPNRLAKQALLAAAAVVCAGSVAACSSDNNAADRQATATVTATSVTTKTTTSRASSTAQTASRATMSATTKARPQPNNAPHSSADSAGGGRVTDVQQPAVTVPTQRERRERYHDSSQWLWLQSSEVVVPGVKLSIEGADGKIGNCSAGFFAHGGGRDFMVWAGHCAHVGDNVYFVDPAGNTLWLGQAVESQFSLGEQDWALVDISNSQAPWSSQLPLDMRNAGAITAADIATYDLQICHLGFRTGMACGDTGEVLNAMTFEAYAPGDHGDSGGPVFAYYEDHFYPAGMVSYGSGFAPDRGYYQLLAPVLEGFGLTLYA